VTKGRAEGFAAYGVRLIELLGLSSSAAGVRRLSGEEWPVGSQALERHRCCQALIRARRGQSVTLNSTGIACPAAGAFRFRTLPEGLHPVRGWSEKNPREGRRQTLAARCNQRGPERE